MMFTDPVYCVTITLKNLFPFNGDFSSVKTQQFQGSNLGYRELTALGDVMLCQISLHNSYRTGRRLVVMKLFHSLGHCECYGHTVCMLSQRCLTAD
jgi:hypothetical protein